MLKRLQIRNSRGFNALEIDQLSGINLIAGKNNSGKTSLLEAISLLVGAGDARLARNVKEPLIKFCFYESQHSVCFFMYTNEQTALFSSVCFLFFVPFLSCVRLWTEYSLYRPQFSTR